MYLEKIKIPKIGIIGGSGLETLPELNKKIIAVVYPKTPYGYPSDKIVISEYKGTKVAFLSRHSRKHSLPPHKIPYKANIAALKQLGIKSLIGTCVGVSLKKYIKPGDFVLLDQCVNLTWGRDDYFNIDKSFIHLPFAQPYCQNLRRFIYRCCQKLKIQIHKKGTVVVTQGPRFSTIAESKWFIKCGWDLVNMTQYPECYFAKELGICYAAIASITDYDVGMSRLHPLTEKERIKIFQNNTKRMKQLILKLLEYQFPPTDFSSVSLVPYFSRKFNF